MAHYAFLDENNIVTHVIVGKNEGEDGVDWEQFYGAVRTSYNTAGGVYYDPETNQPAQDQSKAFRKNYAGIGYSYDSARDAFIPSKPFESWLLDEFSCTWKPPVEYPNDNNKYIWNESLLEWIIVNNGEK
jgi:hypothetical protein